MDPKLQIFEWTLLAGDGPYRVSEVLVRAKVAIRNGWAGFARP